MLSVCVQVTTNALLASGSAEMGNALRVSGAVIKTTTALMVLMKLVAEESSATSVHCSATRNTLELAVLKRPALRTVL